MDNTIIAQLMHDRANEIAKWILLKGLIAGAFLITALAFAYIGYAQKSMAAWVMTGCLCICWVLSEGSCGYYLHINGAENYRLEEQLSKPELGHEHQRKLENRQARNMAPLGFALPFIILFGVTLFTLLAQYRKTGGTIPALLLLLGVLCAGGYYFWLMWAAKAMK